MWIHRNIGEGLPNGVDEAPFPVARAPAELRAWCFEGFEFDLWRGELHGSDGAPIALRPKTEALLRHFLAHPGRLLSRDELIAEV